MYAPLQKANIMLNVTTDAEAFVKTEIPISTWESLQFGHSITMKTRYFGQQRNSLFGKFAELRDISTSSPSGYTFLCMESMQDSPEYRLSRLPREIEFYVKKNSGLRGSSDQNLAIWLEFTFYPIQNLQSESYNKLLRNY